MRIGALTDLHLSPGGAPEERWIHVERLGASHWITVTALRALYDLKPDLIVILGDLTHRGDTRELEYLLGLLDGSPVPAVIIEGNHDLGLHADVHLDRRSVRWPETVRFADPCGLSVQGVRVAGGSVTQAGPNCVLGPDQLPCAPSWGAGEPVVWLAHHPVISMEGVVRSHRLPYAGDLNNHLELLRLLQRHGGPVIALTGHLHVRAHAVGGNVLQLSMAAVVEYPHEVSVIEIACDAELTTVTRRAWSVPGAPKPGDERLPPAVLGPPSSAWRWAGSWVGSE